MNGERDRIFQGEDLVRKLKVSKEAASRLPRRTIRCPVCGFRLLEVYGRGHYILEIKCRKCKFQETIDTAYFRTVRFRKRKRL